MADTFTPWSPGGVLGRYQLIAPLAAGGMAQIWLARQTGVRGFEKLVVIKRMIGALQEEPEFVEMFLAEARLAAALSHRYVVQIYELGDDNGSFYIVMEFIDGESLARIFRAARAANLVIPDALSVQVVAWAAEGLHYAHTFTDGYGAPRGIIHRDVSPQNLLLTADGSIKLIDFGIAKGANELTTSGKLKGKIPYMPPEQARAEQVDARADIFSLGVVLFELLTATRLFGTLEDLEILKRLASGTPEPRCRDRRASVPPELDALVARAMAPDPAERFATAQAFQQALEAWLRTHRTGPPDIAGLIQTLFPKRREERATSIDAIRKSEQVISVAVTLPPEGVSGPTLDGTSTLPPRPSNRRVVVGALIIGTLLITGGGLWWSQRAAPGDAPSAPVIAMSSLALESTPSASAFLDGVPIGSTPLVAASLAPGAHELLIRAPGFVDQRQTLSVGERSERLHVVMRLEPDAGRAEPIRTITIETHTSEIDAGPALVAPVVATGRLNLRTTPWTSVYLGKRKLGDTPLVGAVLPVGSQLLRVVNPEAGLDSSIEVVIKPNQTTTENLALK